MVKSRGVKNIITALISQFFTISLGIIIPRLVLVNLGSEANGLLNSISTAITYMSLLEAGVGTATLQALYLPVSEKDRRSVSQIMSATNYFYRRTGKVYFAVVLIIASLYALFLKTSIPKLDVFLVVLLSGLSGVLSYFFQGKFKILLDAEGKTYITTSIGTVTHIGVSLTKVFVLLAGGNVVAVQSVYFGYNLLQMLAFLVYLRRHYSWVDYNSEPNFAAISQKNAVLFHQISGLIFNNTDVLILTFFTSLKEVSVYSMYALVYGMIKSISVTIDGYIYALGQNFHNKSKFLKMYDAYEVFKIGLTATLFCITHILILPFLSLYTKGVNDINYIDPYIPWLFSVFYLLHNGRQSSANLINIAQRFEDTKWRSFLESLINLLVSLVLTAKMGIYGVLLGTIAALLYRTNDMIIYAARIMERSPWITYRRWLSNMALFILVAMFARRLNIEADSYLLFFIKAILTSFIVVPLFAGLNIVLEPQTTKYIFNIGKDMVKSKMLKS